MASTAGARSKLARRLLRLFKGSRDRRIEDHLESVEHRLELLEQRLDWFDEFHERLAISLLSHEREKPNRPLFPLSAEIRVPGFRSHFLRVSEWPNPTLTAAAIALLDLISHNIPAAVAAGMVAEFAQRYRRLDDDETSVFDVLGRLAQGGSIYKVWVDEETLVGAMAPDLDEDARKRLLANMKSQGILEEGAGKWRAVW